MTTDTQPLAPTGADIENLGHRRCWRYKHSTDPNNSSTYTFNRLTLLDFARDVLARWGQSYGAGEVDRADAVNLARNFLGAHNCVITKKGMRVLAEAVLAMDAALSTPQPTQAQAGAEPLTDEQKNAMWVAATIELPSPQSCYLRGIADAERAHGIGIKGGQHV